MTEEASEPKTITPFKVINRGEDTVDRDDRVVFADFSPKVLPADAPDEEVVVVPKDGSAMAPASSSGASLTETDEPTSSATSAPAPASEDDGKPSQSETGKPDSSSPPKSG